MVFKSLNWENSEVVSINNTNTSALLEDVSDTLTYYADKYIITKYPIKTGDIVEYADITYIVVSQIDRNIENRKENQYNYRARIRQADYAIKLVIDSKLEIFPTIIEGQVFDVVEGKYLTLSDDKIVVTTNNLYPINKGMRFIKFGDVWKVVGVDKTKSGLHILYCDVDIYNASIDDMENEIANIDLIEQPEEPEEPSEPEDPPTGDKFTIEIVGDGTVPIDTTSNYVAKIYNNGVLIDNKSVVWSVSNTRLKLSNVTGTTCTVYADMGDFSYGSYTLKATLSDDVNIFIEKTIEVTAW